MRSALFPTVDAKTICLDGADNLLLYIKKLYRNALEKELNPEQMPEELVPAYNQLMILLNNSITGLKLPETMIRGMLAGIRNTLNDYRSNR